jgi:hypothetical protein
MQDQPDLSAVIEAYGGTLVPKSDHEWHGAHPQHGSSTGVNFDVNTTKHLWHCWRHGTGGDALSLIAVCEGLLACEDLQPGALGGTLFPKVLAIAKTRFGWTPPQRDRLSHGRERVRAPLPRSLRSRLTTTLPRRLA